MTLRKVLQYGHRKLRLKAKPVEVFDANLAQLLDDMVQTMYAEEGVGLAANQIGVLKRVLVMDVSAEQNEPLQIINPSFKPVDAHGLAMGEEGCLSVPEFRAEVKRHAVIQASWMNLDGELVEQELSGLASICYQHELDHLNGKMFVDHLTGKTRRHFQQLQKQKLKESKNLAVAS